MGFSVVVEALNLRLRARSAEPVHLHQARINEGVARIAERATEQMS